MKLEDQLNDLAADIGAVADEQLPTINKSVPEADIIADVDAHSDGLKQRIMAQREHAERDLAYAERMIAEIDEMMKRAATNREGFESMRDEAKQRITYTKYAMVRMV